jgi:phage I-like protein
VKPENAQKPAFPSNPVILNRDFQLPPDNWYQLTPVGEIPNVVPGKTPRRVLQILDSVAADAMVAAFNRAASAGGERFPGILVDRDHFSTDPTQSSAAAGWITSLANRTGELWGQIRWTADGERDIKGGMFRMLSPLWRVSDCADLGNNRLRPMRLESVALTNEPLLKGMVPLSNRDQNNNAQGEVKMDYRTEIVKLLSLPADATDEQIAPALANAAIAGPAIKARVTELETENAALKNRIAESQADADLIEFAPVIDDKAAVREQLIANRDGTLKLLKGLKKPVAATDLKLHNRANTKTPGASSEPVAKDLQRNAAVNDYILKNRCTFETAWDAVRAAQPELFKEETITE